MSMFNMSYFRDKENTHAFFKKSAYPVGLLSLLASIPQIVDVWKYKNVESLSLLTWIGWTLTNIFWIGYGIVDKDKPILFLYIGWFIVNGSVLLAILLF